MASTSELFIPTSPSKFSFRPLNKGMITSETTMSMPDGSFLNVNGYDVTSRGPKKSGAWLPGLYVKGTTTPLQFTSTDVTERIESQTVLLLRDGTSLELLITNRAVYWIDENSGYVRLNWIRDYTVASVSQTSTDTTLTVTGDFRDDFLGAGDFVVFNGVDYPFVECTATETALTITFEGVPTIVPTDIFKIFKPFAAYDAQFVDFATSRGVLYFVDGITQMVWKFDGIIKGSIGFALEPHYIYGLDGVTRTVMGAVTIAAFGERLYFGGILEQDSEDVYSIYRNRIRWTEVLNHGQSLAANYQDLIRTTGRVRKILGMGSLIMAYMDDSVYYGRQTSLTSLPYAFTYIETAGVTSVGMKAVSTYFDGQIFQSSDNVYYISADAQVSPIGDVVSEEIRARSTIPYMSQIFIDTDRSRVLVYTSTQPDILDCVFLFNYKAKAWSINDSVSLVAPVNQVNNDYLYYNELADTEIYNTTYLAPTQYQELLSSDLRKSLYAYMDGYFMRYDESAGLNRLVTGGIVQTIENPCELITPDFDFDDPDTYKTSLRISLKISDDPDTIRTENLYFLVDGSRDRGLTWKPLGRMRILPDRDEDALNFRLSGSTLRFRIRQGYEAEGTSTNVAPFTISEIVLRLRERSIEAQRSNAREG